MATKAIILLLLAASAAEAYIPSNWTYRTNTSPTCDGTLENPCGPEFWVNIEPRCDSNLLQGPANLEDSINVAESDPPNFQYTVDGCTTWRQGADAISFEVRFVGCRNLSVSYRDRLFYLESIHFHSPSEHSIGGGFYDAEAHMLHFSEDRELFLVGVFLHSSATNLRRTNNSMLNTLWSNGGGSIEEISKEKDVMDFDSPLQPYLEFFPPTKSYFAYEGSLTTPPCTPANWIVYETPITISMDDLSILRGTVSAVPNNLLAQDGNNNRPVQPKNGRTIKYVSTDEVMTSSSSPVDEELTAIEEGFLIFAVLSTILFWLLLITLGICICRHRKMFASSQNSNTIKLLGDRINEGF